MKRLVSILFYFILLNVNGQNLVPNPSFEDINESMFPPYGPMFGANGLIYCAMPWFQPALVSTSDLHFSFFDHPLSEELVRTGIASSRIGVFDDYNFIHGLQPNWDSPREYIEVELLEELTSNEVYVVSFFVYLAGCSPMHNGIGIYFSTDSILYSNVDFMQTPWDQSLTPIEAQLELEDGEIMPTNQWYHFEKTYVATGGEKFITIGNFIEDEKITFITDSVNCFGFPAENPQSSYMAFDPMFIDDVSIFPMGVFQDIANTGNDTTICVGIPIVLGTHNYENYSYEWSDSNGVLYDSLGQITVSPMQTTSYYLSVKDFAFMETYDTITVNIDDCINYTADAGLDTSICLGLNIQLYTEFYSNYQYTWFSELGDQWNQYYASITPFISQDYYLEVVDDTGVAYTDTVYIEIVDCNEFQINAGADTTICLGDTLILSEVEYPFYTYLWTNDFGQQWNTPVIEITPELVGSYYLEVSNGLGDTQNDVVQIVVLNCEEDIVDILMETVKITPNPVSSLLEIKSTDKIDSWRLLDAVGKKVASSKHLESSRNLVLDVSSFDAGLYFLELRLENQVIIKQLLIE